MAEERAEGEVALPIQYGTIAWQREKVADQTATHGWLAFVRGAENQDISHTVQSVQFDLHQSFSQPQVIITSPPFEISNTGWGEFDMCITIHFHQDVHESPLQFLHFLKLYHDESISDSGKASLPVIRVASDDVVFHKPWFAPSVVLNAWNNLFLTMKVIVVKRRLSFKQRFQQTTPTTLPPTQVDDYSALSSISCVSNTLRFNDEILYLCCDPSVGSTESEEEELTKIARARKAIARAAEETSRIKAMYDEWLGIAASCAFIIGEAALRNDALQLWAVQVAEQQFICASTVLEVISSLSNAARIGINLLLDACEAAGSDVLTAMRHLSNVTTMIPRELALQSGDEQLHSHSSLISSLAAANDCFAAVLPLALDRMAEESQASDLLNRWWQCARRVTSCMRLCSTSASQPLQKVLGYAERAYCLRKDRVLIEDCDAHVSVAHAEQQPTSAVASLPGTSLRLSETLIRRDDTPPVSEYPRAHLHDGLAQLHTAESAEWASSFVHAMN